MKRTPRRAGHRQGGDGRQAVSPIVQAQFAEALRTHRAGRLDQAERLFRQILAAHPRHADSLFLLGTIAQQTGRHDLALDMIGKAIAVAPQVAAYHYSLGNVLKSRKQWPQAVRAYRKALDFAPDFADALNNLANVLMDLGRRDEAVTVYRRVLDLTPDDPDTHHNLGMAMMELEKRDEAAACFHRAIALAPADAEAHCNLGTALKCLERRDEALQAYRRALTLRPRFPEAQCHLADVLWSMGRLDEAASHYQHVLALDSDLVAALCGLGNTLRDMGRLEPAAAAYQRAIHLRPDFADAHNGLGNIMRDLDRQEEAAAHYRKAIALNPDFVLAYHNLGGTLSDQGLAAEAMAMQRAALAADKAGGIFAVQRSMLSTALYGDGLDAGQLRAIHQAFAARFGGRGPLVTAFARAEPHPGRLRIGYLSSDLRQHPMTANMAPVWRGHDHSRFDIHFYSAGNRPDHVTQALRAQADGWHDVAGYSDEAIARRIQADGIHILVCLAGRFDENRLGVCGWRAAPVQISLHDVATSGLAEMDYIIGDGRLLPRHTTEYFSERPLRLPRFYVADLPQDLPPLPATPRQGPPMFCCFNNPAKITPTMLGLWGRILAQSPDSGLTLKYMGRYASPELCRRFLGAITAAGAQADQVTFVAERDGTRPFLPLYNGADIALDTAPFSGSTTTFQALAMGVPVVTWRQDRMVSRWTAAMLRPLGLEALIADSAETYVAAALAAAREVESWRASRQDIRDRLARSSLCHSPRWTRHLERLYTAIWRRHEANQITPA